MIKREESVKKNRENIYFLTFILSIILIINKGIKKEK